MKIEEIREIGTEELVKRLDETRQELFNLKLRLSTKQLVNHREIPRVRRDIARIETVIKQRTAQPG